MPDLTTLDIPKGTTGIIFDCDGTLVANMHLHFIAWREAFLHFNAEFTREFLSSTSGMPHIETVLRYNKVYGTSIDPHHVTRLKEQCYEDLRDQAVPVEAVCDLARRYYGILPMSVVSGSGFPSVTRSIALTGLEACFPIVITADNHLPPKPNPDMFIEAARSMGVSPGGCVVLEDGVAGMEGARAAGMHVIDVRPFIPQF
eukprot:gnl/Dysnectes_brevis/2308_a2717_1606.p1 GENE.gnl/Dysnectes_brevis/2308_a2717_1606~~gnl/Dysnectes_brevis/2308_a2717_1606.p1  ORF type:complete len:201 (-),score=34.17 gnl/Dysnectes_brevis/2308_a2717_1606:42-644(-)